MTAGWANPSDLSRLYAVDMGCGHVEMRRMKPSTAAAAMSPDGQIRREEICGACRTERDAVEIPTLVASLPHSHEVEHMPSAGNGWAVCSCGATLRIENGKPAGQWHACELCSTEAHA